MAGVIGAACLGSTLALSACDEKADASTADVRISGKKFTLELALDDEHRFHGLSGRTEIKEDGGMLFVFDRGDERDFVMRDCPIPIDIIYLNGAGRVVAFHKMVPEPERSAEEKELSPPKDSRGRPVTTAPKWTWTNEAYENRLKRYPSKHPAQFVVELKGNTLDTLKVKEGDKVELDVVGLKKRAK